MKKKDPNVAVLGASLKKFKKDKKRFTRHTTELVDTSSEKLRSVIHQNDLTEFVQMAELSNKKFFSENDEVTLIVNDDKKYTLKENGFEEKRSEVNSIFPIPRKPKWNSEMTREDVDNNEKAAFLDWRRKLASIEDSNDYILTPYEKNLNIWRQLWRVLEKSDIVCQIIDARNPSLFRSEDLEKYITEMDSHKKSILILNKSDLLTKKQRFAWASYFKKLKVNFLFFSAYVEQEKIEKDEETKKSEKIEDDWTHVYSRDELMDYFLSHADKKVKRREGDPAITIGMVGYPNVGKSSLINVLCKKKRVAVASTPGKTKHLQTIPLENDILLADCPGLVFPSVSVSKEEMVVDGILPIDELREWRAPIRLIVERIPRRVLELTYGLKFGDKKLTSNLLLDSYAISKGMMSHKGIPNAANASRKLLKDYVSGKLLFCHAPPSMTFDDEDDQEDEEDNEEEVDQDDLEEDDENEEEYFSEDEEVLEHFNDVNINSSRLDEKEKSRKKPGEKVDYFKIELQKLRDKTGGDLDDPEVETEVEKYEKMKQNKIEGERKYRLQNVKKQIGPSPSSSGLLVKGKK